MKEDWLNISMGEDVGWWGWVCPGKSNYCTNVLDGNT